jgi:hypothetical protein
MNPRWHPTAFPLSFRLSYEMRGFRLHWELGRRWPGLILIADETKPLQKHYEK